MALDPKKPVLSLVTGANIGVLFQAAFSASLFLLVSKERRFNDRSIGSFLTIRPARRRVKADINLNDLRIKLITRLRQPY